MRSWGVVRLLQFVSGLRVAHLHGVAAVGALLACFAVVLNVGPFAKTHKREIAPAAAVAYGPDVRDIFRLAVAEKSVAATPMARLQAGAGARSDSPLPAKDAINLSDRFKLLGQFAPAADAADAPVMTQPAKPAERDAELQAVKSARPDGGDPAARPRSTVVGVWAPDTGACSVRDFQEGLLPAIIKTDGAWAGETFCAFTKKQETKTGWRVVANCSNEREHWTADVRLTVKNNRLTWSSKRGTQSYKRCAPNFLMAAAR
jgi:hypothetical protein